MHALVRRLDQRYAWVVVAGIFVLLMISAGARSMPGVLLVPIEGDLHWGRATTSTAVSVGIALYGLMGPFAAALILRFGLRRTIPAALVVLAISCFLSTRVQSPWQLIATWGLLSGTATGTMASVLAATVANQWFRKNRGLALGILTASVQTGQLVFLPVLASVAENAGWRNASLVVGAVALAIIPLFLFFVPERPSAVNIPPLGGTEIEPPPTEKRNPIVNAFAALNRAVRVPRFWLLAGSFFVCGLSTNGLIGTHMIALCADHGLPEVKAAWLLAAMGIFDLMGTTASGWLSDRYNNWALLGWYYGLRGLALLFLPFSDFGVSQLTVFAVFYGLDWIATVPPTVRLTTEAFGEKDGPLIYGWIATGHQLGAAVAAAGAGLIRSEYASYLAALIVAGLACVIAGATLTGAAFSKKARGPITATT
jgi:predicted MFS family arabinose efflux permease